METRPERCAIAIMAKTPRAGASKTRLCPPLRPEQAAFMAAAFLADMTATLARATLARAIGLGPDRIDGFVAYAPAGSEAGIAPHVAPGIGLLLADGAGTEGFGVTGFGCVLLQTMRSLFAMGYTSACVLNSDSPTLPVDHLLAAAAALRPGPAGDARPAVLGCVDDGGYYLLGLRHADAMMFADIDWSTGQVAAQTRRQAGLAGLTLASLPDWYDVDDAAGLRHLARDLQQAGPGAAPATAAALGRLDLQAAHAEP